MPDLIAPHGASGQLVDRCVPKQEEAEFLRQAAGLTQVPLSEGDLSTLFRIGDGALTPLTGPMTRPVFDRVLAEEVLLDGETPFAWTIPLAFPILEEQAKQLSVGQTVALTHPSGEIVGTLEIHDIYPFDKPTYIRGVYGTDRTDHPGARIVTEDPRTMLLGGSVRVVAPPAHPAYGQFLLSPRQARALFAQRGWQRVVAFQTRNPLHRAHEYALVVGIEQLTRAGFFAGAVLNPLVGETKSDDVDAATRMRTYQALLDNRALGDGDTDDSLWQKVGYGLHDQLLLLGLDIKMFYAGPKEAIMHAIYRQNYGFTDIIIGRKHADAPYDDKTEIWDALAAQRKFDELRGKLLIQPVKVGFAAFYAEIGRVGLVEDYQPKGYQPVSISGSQIRESLRQGVLPDPRIMRPETARVLIERMRQA